MPISPKYTVIRVLGTGTFGQACLAIQNESGKNVVIKRINVFRVQQREIDLALMEVAILGKLRHINIVKYKDSFVADHQLNIVMEYADSGDLHDKITQQNGENFKEKDILDWFVQTMFALRYIHSRYILHRDLKTQNIFLTSRNIIKLGDFGIAKVLQDTADMAVTTIGTPYYMSPEICAQQPYKSDMWAAGCVLYEMCHLQVPFNATSLAELVMKILSGNYAPLPRVYGPILEDLIGVLLSVEADNRPSADQVICIPALQPYVDRYIVQCRLVIRGVDTDTTADEKGAEKRPLVDAESMKTTPPTFSIYKDILKKRAVSVRCHRNKSSVHFNKPVTKSAVEPHPKTARHVSMEGIEIENDEVFAEKENHPMPSTRDREPPVVGEPSKLTYCVPNKKSKLTYKVGTKSLSGLANAKVLVEKQIQELSKNDTYRVKGRGSITEVMKKADETSSDDKISHDVYSILFKSMVQSNTSRRTAIETLRGKLEVEWGRDRVAVVHAALLSARKNNLKADEFFVGLTQQELLFFPLVQQIVVLENLGGGP